MEDWGNPKTKGVARGVEEEAWEAGKKKFTFPKGSFNSEDRGNRWQT